MKNPELETEIISERWQLARLNQETLFKWALLAVAMGGLFVCFHYFGNTTMGYVARLQTHSVFIWIVQRWSDAAGDMSHGPFIPLASLFFIWLRRKEIAAAPRQVSNRGLAVVIGCLLLHWLGAKSQQTRLSLIALIGLSWGIPYYLCGWKTAKWLIFPCSYLLFAVPFNFLDSLTFPLRIMATIISEHLLQGLGLPIQRSGSAIYSLSAGGFAMDVADPCSGIRSLLAMTALTAAYANLTQKGMVRQWGLFLMSIPLAIVGNIVRITSIAIVAEAFGEQLALGLYHDYSSYILFSVSITLMVVMGYAMNVDWKGWIRQWIPET